MNMEDNKDFNLNNKLAEIEIPEEIAMIDGILDEYKNYKILSLALKLGIFEKIKQIEPTSPRRISEATSINGMFIRSILIALEDMGFLKSDKNMYLLTEPAEIFLCKKSPIYQGDYILSLGKDESEWNDLLNIVERKKPPELNSKKLDEYQIRSLAQQCIRGEVQNVIKEIISYPEFSEYKHLLDIGGTHGLYSTALCQENKALSATIIEQDQVVPLTTSIVREYGMENRIEVQKGNIKNLMKGHSEEGYDIVLISHLLYRYRREMADILEDITQILNPGGIMVLNHRFCSPNCDIEPGAGVREIDRALSSFGHPLCHPEGLKEVLEDLGFKKVTLIPHETALGYAVLCIGNKDKKYLGKTSDKMGEHTSDPIVNGDDKCC